MTERGMRHYYGASGYADSGGGESLETVQPKGQGLSGTAQSVPPPRKRRAKDVTDNTARIEYLMAEEVTLP